MGSEDQDTMMSELKLAVDEYISNNMFQAEVKETQKKHLIL